MKTLLISLAVLGGVAAAVPTHALTVSTLDCSGIDTQDGHVQDWENIPYLIDTQETVDGTTYYLTEDMEWITDEPGDYVYSVNLEKQANIQEMKVCNTDIFLMMLRTEEPMMAFYDRANDTYVDFWQGIEGDDGSFTSFTLPADYHYWMVWKMQKADGAGAITYMAADLTMDEGRELDGDADAEDPVPGLYLYEETDAVSYDEADFNPLEDTQLTEIELSEQDGECDPEDESDDAYCEPDDLSGDDIAFEVSQNIAQLFEYADFSYGDTINMTGFMYNSDTFESATGTSHMSVVDATETTEYTFSQRAIRGLNVESDYLTDKRAKLTWKSMKNARSYTLRLINPISGYTVRTIQDIEKPHKTIKSLKSDTTYRAIVRAVLPKVDGEKQFSAWSSGVRFTTDEQSD